MGDDDVDGGRFAIPYWRTTFGVEVCLVRRVSDIQRIVVVNVSVRRF